MSKYGHRNGNWFESIVNKLGGEEAGDAFLRGELTVVRKEPKWLHVDGVIYFSVTSDGTTGEAWIERLEAKGFLLSDYAKQLLRSQQFKPTNGETTLVAVLKSELFADSERYIKNVRSAALKRNLRKISAEIACLIREKFTDKEIEEMDLWGIVVMHDTIKCSENTPCLLAVDRYDSDNRNLSACYDAPHYKWDRDNGFAFAVSKSSLS